MLAQNVFNSEKATIEGSVFHLFYMDLNTSVLYDRDLTKPIIWGSKTIVIGALKKIDEKMNECKARAQGKDLLLYSRHRGVSTNTNI